MVVVVVEVVDVLLEVVVTVVVTVEPSGLLRVPPTDELDEVSVDEVISVDEVVSVDEPGLAKQA